LVVEPTHLKNMNVKMDSSSPSWDENKQYLKPPARDVMFSHVGWKLHSPIAGTVVTYKTGFLKMEKLILES